MMGLNEIKRMNKEAMGKAEKENKQPYVAKADGDEGVRNAPYIGNYLPNGWKPTEEYFVDSSGLGSPDELAMTFGQFLEKVKEGHGYAISETGQFQVYIQEFERE